MNAFKQNAVANVSREYEGGGGVIEHSPEKSPYVEDSNAGEARLQPHHGAVASSIISAASIERLHKQNKFLCWNP